MARQVGNTVFLGTRFGCTGYAMDGRAYMRRRSSLDGRRWRRDAAFGRTRAAAAVFGGASAFAARFWRAIPGPLKRLMDEGAYNRLVNAVREAHVLNAAEVRWHAARQGRAAYPAVEVPTFSVAALGGLLNGLDLSEGQLLGDGVGLLARDLRGKLYHGSGDLLHLQGAGRVGFAGMHSAAAGLLGMQGGHAAVTGRKMFLRDGRVFVPADIAAASTGAGHPIDAVRWRLHVSAVAMMAAPSLKASADTVFSDWVVLEAGDEVSASGPLLVDVPYVADGMRFVGLEVAVRRNGRWKRLACACKVFVLECGEGKVAADVVVVVRAGRVRFGDRGAVRGGRDFRIFRRAFFWGSG